MRPQFLKRLPRLRWRPQRRDPLVEPDLRSSAPELAADFDVLSDELVPLFDELDEGALQAQNDFRLSRLLVILGGATATALGAVQSAMGGGAAGIGIAGAVVAGVLAGMVAYLRGSEPQQEYFTARLKAERLRGEYFLFLGRITPYDVEDAEERRRRLHRRIVEIQVEEPA
jgi:hypothetical protein